MPRADRPYEVYLILCGDGSLYVGMTHDVALRYVQHVAGHGSLHTRLRGVSALLGHYAVGDRAAANREEKRLKRLKRARKLAAFGLDPAQVPNGRPPVGPEARAQHARDLQHCQRVLLQAAIVGGFRSF